jgi:hypothetical protein
MCVCVCVCVCVIATMVHKPTTISLVVPDTLEVYTCTHLQSGSPATNSRWPREFEIDLGVLTGTRWQTMLLIVNTTGGADAFTECRCDTSSTLNRI